MFIKTGSGKKFTSKIKNSLPKTELDKEQEQEARKMHEAEKFQFAEMPKSVKKETKLIFNEPTFISNICTHKEPTVSESIRSATIEIMRLFSGHDNINLDIKKTKNSLSIQIN